MEQAKILNSQNAKLAEEKGGKQKGLHGVPKLKGLEIVFLNP